MANYIEKAQTCEAELFDGTLTTIFNILVLIRKATSQGKPFENWTVTMDEQQTLHIQTEQVTLAVKHEYYVIREFVGVSVMSGFDFEKKYDKTKGK